MTTSKMLEKWLDILNQVSGALEEHITCEEDQRLLLKLDEVIDDIYTLRKTMPLVESKGGKNG